MAEQDDSTKPFRRSSGKTSRGDDEAPCGPKNPCGKYMWTPFNVLSTLQMLMGLLVFVMGFSEGATTSRWLAYWQWEAVALANMVLQVVSWVLIIIFASQKFPIQRTENPSTHQYKAVIAHASWGFLFGLFFWLTLLLYRVIGLPQNIFDQLNTISVATADICGQGGQTAQCTRYQLFLFAFGWAGLALLTSWLKVVMAEIAPLKTKSADAAAMSSIGNGNGNGRG
jgi:hypothetical protein